MRGHLVFRFAKIGLISALVSRFSAGARRTGAGGALLARKNAVPAFDDYRCDSALSEAMDRSRDKIVVLGQWRRRN